MAHTDRPAYVNKPHTPLMFYFGLGYTVLIVYASLYPFSGWQSSGISPFDFFFAGWPRYTTTFDLLINVAAYIPLGFFLATALRPRVASKHAWWLAVLAAAGLSFVLEFTQNYLPSRVASNLDWAGNTCGAFLGALPGALWRRQLIDNLRHTHWPDHGQSVELGFVLLGLWLLTQLDPTTVLFGAGDLRSLLPLLNTQPFSAAGFVRIESLIAASGLLAMLLMASLIAPPHQRRLFPLLLLAVGLAAKSLAFALMTHPQTALAWATPGGLMGSLAGGLLWLVALALPLNWQRLLAALALLAASIMVNLAPVNPYLENLQNVWNPGQFLNFHGLTHFITLLWPYLALPWFALHRTYIRNGSP
ncbi:MAG TPA: VanZ family protein [Rugosibacter sp.]